MSSTNDNGFNTVGINDNGPKDRAVSQSEINAKEIQVEDPVNFLNLQEKQEYMLAHQETIARGEVPLDKLSDLPRPEQMRQQDTDFDAEFDSYAGDLRRDDVYLPEEEAGRVMPRHDLRQNSGRPVSERREAYEKRAENVGARERQEEEEVRYRDYDERSGIEKGLSVAVKLGLVAIVLLLLTMVILFFLPSIKRAIGMGSGDETAGTGITLPQETTSAAGDGQQAGVNSSEQEQQTVQPEETQETQTENPNARTVTVTADTLNLRDLPGWMEGSEVICKVKKGDQLTVISQEEGWLKVSYDGRELYCSEDYVE